MSEMIERLAWLRLARTPRVGPVTFQNLISVYGSATDALEALPDRARQRGIKLGRIPSISDAEREWEAHEKIGAKILLSSDDDFPTLLKALDPPPPLISFRGDAELFNRPSIAMVGSRNASAVGRRMATNLANGLADKGYVVISGLARGIDSVCHTTTLDRGTIAVIAGGIDTIYPPEHAQLQEEIATRGGLVSELRFSHSPTAKDFPKRNRLITGLSLGVIIVEAAERSGTLISARCALEQGREVMAVPGSPLDPRARGANRLLKQGAALVETVDDVIEALGEQRPRATFRESLPSDMPFRDGLFPENLVARVEGLLAHTPVQIDTLAESADVSVPECLSILVELELQGRASTLAGGMASKRVR